MTENKSRRIWVITEDHINEIQATTIHQAIERAKTAKHIDILMYHGGACHFSSDHRLQADWLKHAVELEITKDFDINTTDPELIATAARLYEAHSEIERLRNYIKAHINPAEVQAKWQASGGSAMPHPYQ